MNAKHIVLFGRSSAVLNAAQNLLTKQGHEVLPYQVTDTNATAKDITETFSGKHLDLIVLGAGLPDEKKALIQKTMTDLSPGVMPLNASGPIPPMIVEQVVAALANKQRLPTTPAYNVHTKTLSLTIPTSQTSGTITCYWIVSQADLTSDKQRLHAGTLEAGTHTLEVPSVVTEHWSFATIDTDKYFASIPISPRA